MTFNEFICKLELDHFKPEELLVGNNEPNSKPPCKLWNNIVPTILIVQKLRKYFDVPIYLSSAYRNEEYNRTIKNAAPRSLHQAFAALDIRFDGSYKGELTLKDLYEKLKSWRDMGKWFKSPVPICTCPETLSDGQETPHENLEVHETDNGYEFRFKGYLRLYATHIHIDTRGYNE
ncbi:hypothetical protein C6501_01595 [Candidatus Poribacteria bacterium]|nr:MAG: hypothetical protein C6501_01595 [Candidatus Poribacteria bacterium]